jgi:DNA ligase-1
MNFKLLQQLVDELNSSNSMNDKKSILFKSEYNDQFIKDAFIATYNPFVQYYVTPANLKKNSNLCVPNDLDLFDLLNKLSSREITGHDAIGTVNGFILNHPGFEELIYNIFDRNLKTRTTSSIINKVHKKLIPTFDVVLAKKYEDHIKKVKFDIDRWFASRKLDGLRCVAIIDNFGDIKIKSRTGNTFHTLQLVIDELKKLNLKGVVFDGEICIIDKDGNEDFQAILKEYNKKNHTIENPRYKIFDMISLEDFNNKKGDELLSDRIIKLGSVFLKNKEIIESTNILSYLEQTLVRDEKHLQELRDEAKKLKWEGMMIRKDVGYEGKRSDKLLKCKLFEDAEYVVVDVVMKDQRIIITTPPDMVEHKMDDGSTVMVDIGSQTREVTEEMLSKVIIEHKGFEVGVGSGWSLEQRRLYYDHPEQIIGKEITVQYFEETQNEKGELSLRFPTVKCVWEDGKRNV